MPDLIRIIARPSLLALALASAPTTAADKGTNKLVNNIDTNGTDYSVRFCFQTTDVGASTFCADAGEQASSDYSHGPKNIHVWYSANGTRLPWINLDSSCRTFFDDQTYCDLAGGSGCRSAKLRDNDGGGTNTFTVSGTVLNDINGLTLRCSASNLHVD